MQEPTERSLSRGRQLISSGRGGMGNMHTASVDSRPQTGPDDLSITRGRDLAINPDRVLSIGRGGAGNIRSPSCHSPVTPQAIDLRQQELLKAEGGDRTQLVSFGRGGLGNMGRSPSRGALLNQENSEITAVRSRSASRDAQRSTSQSKEKPSGVSGFLHKILQKHVEEEQPQAEPIAPSPLKSSIEYSSSDLK